MRYFFLIKNAFILIFPLVLLAQNNQKDLSKLSYKELRVIFFKDYDENNGQMKYAKYYFEKAVKEKNELEKGRGYYLLAFSSYYKDIDLSLKYFQKALLCSKENNDFQIISKIHYYIAGIFQRQLKFKEAVNNFILAEKFNTDEDFAYELKLNIGVIKSEYLGEVDEALQLYKQCYKYYNKMGARKTKYNSFYQEILFDIADAYKAKKMIDSATYYNKLGIIESKFSNDELMLNLFILNEGANQVMAKNFKVALDSINKALPVMIEYENKGNTLAGYYYSGKAYEGLKKESLALKNYQYVDSMYLLNKEIEPEFSSGYTYLINYYKKKGDKANQLKYITRFMGIDSVFQKNYKETYKIIQNEYVIPNLIKDRESLIISLKNDKRAIYWVLGGLSLVTVGFVVISMMQYKQKKEYRKRFEKIMAASKEEKHMNPITANEDKEKEDIGIADEIVAEILAKLENFERKNKFTKANITSKSLAEEFKTNSKYLAKIIKHYRGKPFIQYINDLRVDYVISQLQIETKLRNYTMMALAKEFGFNTAESFSAAFTKKTGIKPTYFIKELDNDGF